MATGARFVLPFATVIDGSGVPLPGAQLFFYATGTNTPANTYSDSLLTIPNGNPVVANAAGRFGNIFMSPTITYKVVLEDQFGSVLWTADPVVGLGGGIGGNSVQITEAAAPPGVANAIVLYTDDGETLKYKDPGNNVLVVQTAPVVNNVGSFTSMNATIDTGGRVTAASNGSAASGALAAEFSYSVGSGSGPDIGSPAGTTWTKRLLNTTVFNNIPGCSLTTNSVTLPAGTYLISYWQAYNTAANIWASGRLRNTTDGTSLAVTQRGLTIINTATAIAQSTIFTIAGAKVFELDIWFSGANGAGGDPTGSGENEVYVRLSILKIA